MEIFRVFHVFEYALWKRLWKFSVVSGFLNMLYGKKRKPGNAESQQKAF